MLAKITPDGNRIEVSQMSKSDLGHIETISRAKRWSWQAKKYIEVSYLYMFTFLPSGFYKRLLSLNKDGLVQNLTLKGMEYITNNIIQEDLEEWVMDEDYMFSPKWYQSKALYLSLRFNRMRIEIATGGGKSFIIAMCYHLFAHKLSLLPVNQAKINHNFSKKDTTLPFEDKDYVILPHSFFSVEQH